MSVVNDTQVAGVKKAVEKLEELGSRMCGDGFGFKEEDVVNLEKLVKSITELEDERKLIHEKLETETIKCSILRHELKQLPHKLRSEMMMAVTAARQSNADMLRSRRDQLEDMNSNIQDLETRATQLEKENIVCRPEHELLKQKHEEIILQLNHKMAEKASMQISLNETRDKARLADQHMLELEQAMVQLKENLIQERSEAKQEKKQLRKLVADTLIKTREQREKNVQKKQGVDRLVEQFIDSEDSLSSVKKSHKHYLDSKKKLMAEEQELNQQLDHQLKQNEDLQQHNKKVLDEVLEEQQDFEDKQNQLVNQQTNFENEITNEKERGIQLELQKIELSQDLEEKEKVKEKDSAGVKELDGLLQARKQKLAQKAEEVGRLYSENVKLTQDSKSLLESHKTVVNQYNRQLQEVQEQLTTETMERTELQIKKDETAKILEDLKSEQKTFMTEVAVSIQEGKKKHTHLSSQGQELQKIIRTMEAEVKELQSHLSSGQLKFDNMVQNMQTKVDGTKEEIEGMKCEIEETRDRLVKETPVFKELESSFVVRTAEYDRIKKSVVVLKNQKSQLLESITRAKIERENLKNPQETLKTDLKVHRTEVMSQIKFQGADTTETERQILLTSSHLRTVLEENSRFEEACEKLEKDLQDLEIQAQENEKMKLTAQNALVAEKSDLIHKWRADSDMQKVFTSRDQAMAESFEQLKNVADKREHKIDEVTQKLRQEVEILSGFLNSITTKQKSATVSAVAQSVQ